MDFYKAGFKMVHYTFTPSQSVLNKKRWRCMTCTKFFSRETDVFRHWVAKHSGVKSCAKKAGLHVPR